MKNTFKTELHCHSEDASPCGKENVESLVDIYTAAGYSTVVLTNHFNRHCFRFYESKDWNTYVDFFVEAFEKFKKAAQGRLNVLFGAELRFDENFNDYLWIGADADFLRKHPTTFEFNVKDFHEICTENGWLLVQAHPFRRGMTVIEPSWVDGVEVYNGHTGHESRNFLAEAWANEYGLRKTSGTDLHQRTVAPTGGIETDEEIVDVETLLRVLKGGKYSLLKSDKAR